MKNRIRTPVCLILLSHALAMADSWPRPKPVTIYSLDSTWKARVFPRKLGLFKTEVSYTKLYRKSNGSYKKVNTYGNGYDFSPVDAYLLSNGGIIYLDNWHEMGYGQNVISLYDSTGKMKSTYDIKHVLDSSEYFLVPHSVSSIWWRDSVFFSENGTALNVLTVFKDSTKDDWIIRFHGKNYSSPIRKIHDTLVTHLNLDSGMKKWYADRRPKE